MLECPGVSLADKASFELESARAFEYKYSLLLQSKDIQHVIGLMIDWLGLRQRLNSFIYGQRTRRKTSRAIICFHSFDNFHFLPIFTFSSTISLKLFQTFLKTFIYYWSYRLTHFWTDLSESMSENSWPCQPSQLCLPVTTVSLISTVFPVSPVSPLPSLPHLELVLYPQTQHCTQNDTQKNNAADVDTPKTLQWDVFICSWF